MSAGRHVTLVGLARLYIDDSVKQVGLAMLTTEVSAYDVLMVSKVSFAGLATIYLVAIEICVVSQPHCLMSCPWEELARQVWTGPGPEEQSIDVPSRAMNDLQGAQMTRVACRA